jgi:hypothetical protein
MNALTVHVDGIGWRTSGAADWNEAAAQLRSGAVPSRDAGVRCAPPLLPPNERRRAPLPVLLACDVAAQAAAMAALDPARLRCVFASMHGDLAITAAMCETLATNPLDMSPTKFHNSVLNAPAGYWTVATGCHAPSNALSAFDASFAAGLLEAAVEALADGEAALFASYDIAGDGPLGDLLGARSGDAVALVLAPRRTERTLASLRLRHEPTPSAPAASALDAALPLFDALARGTPAQLRLPSGASTSLVVEVLA